MKNHIIWILVLLVCIPSMVAADTSDTVQMGLRRSVKSVETWRAVYEHQNGIWVKQNAIHQGKIEFNQAGYKTTEWFYGRNPRRNTYSYDRAGRLVAREEYNSSRLSYFWEKTFGSEGSRSTEIRYNKDGSENVKTLRRFDSAGIKRSDIRYDHKGNVVQRWERIERTVGDVVNFDPQWGANEVTRFDPQGRVIEMRKGYGDTLQKWTYTYNDANRIAEARYQNKDPSADFYTFSYNSRGLFSAVVHNRDKDVTVSKRSYTYTGSANIVTETVTAYDQDGNLDHVWFYRYDADGAVVEKRYAHKRRIFSCRWTFQFDSDGRLITETFFDSEDRVFTQNRTIYDSRGNKIMEHSSGRGLVGGEVNFEYDEADRLLETLRYDSEGRQLSRQSNRYNGQGDLGETASYNPDGSLMRRTEYQYRYDDNVNWTERTTLETNNALESYRLKTEVIFRKLTYH